MDARITKSRLANQLSYDWIKILLAIAAAVAAVCMLFTIIATQPTAGQSFELFLYTDVLAGSDFNTIDAALTTQKVFSYDILKVTTEIFSQSNAYSTTVLAGRRTTGEGTAMLIADYPIDDGDETTEDLGALSQFVQNYRDETAEGYSFNVFYDPEAFLREAEEYVAGFFGEAWRTAPAEDTEAVRTAFLARNGKDKRFKSAKAKEAGVEQERVRLQKLKEDLIAVEEAFEEGLLSVRQVPLDENTQCNAAVCLGGLARIGNLAHYTVTDGESTAQVTDTLCLALFSNGKRDGDLKYETISLLRYLVEAYK